MRGGGELDLPEVGYRHRVGSGPKRLEGELANSVRCGQAFGCPVKAHGNTGENPTLEGHTPHHAGSPNVLASKIDDDSLAIGDDIRQLRCRLKSGVRRVAADRDGVQASLHLIEPVGAGCPRSGGHPVAQRHHDAGDTLSVNSDVAGDRPHGRAQRVARSQQGQESQR